ncbi:MAG: hypothetical protein R2707_19080 [Acidimicrobiales bacterium]
MPADERTRLLIRQHFVELMNEELADAIMESMPPIPWSEIATKSDLTTLEQRIDARFRQVDDRFEQVNDRFEQVNDRFEQVNDRFDQIDGRLDLIDGRFRQHDNRFDQMERYISNELVGLEGRLSLRFTEAVRLVVVSVVLLFAGVLGLAATYIATG